MYCELCQRQLEHLTLHHLIPRQKTKRRNEPPSATIEICSACHRQIHSLFDNQYLAKELNTLEKLQQEPQMAKFLQWVRKQKPDKRIPVNRAKG
ncbi:MAG: hypothetical protein F6K32_05845 [Desertifilum sp. SIO1I2]|nr:hypothetical protein [Desertifilum sp. SIO1I2]